MRKQNYMTNRKIKEAADKNQKGYQPPEEEVKEESNVNQSVNQNQNANQIQNTNQSQNTSQEQEPSKVKYYFKSYSDANKTDVWGTGSVETTGNTQNGFVEVKVLTNTGDSSFIDALFFITKDAKTDGTVYQLYNDAGTTGTGIYVEISSSPIE